MNISSNMLTVNGTSNILNKFGNTWIIRFSVVPVCCHIFVRPHESWPWHRNSHISAFDGSNSACDL